jgi:PKD repeat protein/endonuclease/exonuclease/phosphatase family metal-dependent hydrolase
VKRSVILIGSLASLCWLPSSYAQNVRVMQWNVKGYIGNIASNNTPEAKAIARIVNYNQPDIVTFCELQDRGTINTAAGVTDWVTNNLPYFGSQLNGTFWVYIAFYGDGSERNGSISRYPLSDAFTYSDAGSLGGTNYPTLRGMQRFRVQLSGTNVLEVFHVHLKCCNICSGPTCDCPQRQSEAETDATNMTSWATSNPTIPYIFTGDCNEDEGPNQLCPLTTNYHPITTLIQGGGLADYRPRTLTPGIGATLTWSTTAIATRFDYVLGSTNRIPSSAIVTGFVFRSQDWATYGLYTNASPQNLVNDSQAASDHYCVQVTYSFPTSATNFNVTPATSFDSGGGACGPFAPASQVYTLTNSDSIPLFWSVTKTSDWLTVSTLATNLTLGVGKSTNITASINSQANLLAPGSYTDTINFSNAATGVSIPRLVTLIVQPAPPSASFTGSPTNGLEPLAVTFTDTSSGCISNRFWDFGDGSTTNTTTNSVAHMYASGNYDVTLVASGLGGVATNTKPNYITVLPASTVAVVAADLQDQFGNLMPTSGVAALVVDTGANGFADLQSTFPLVLGAAWGADDRVVGLWDLLDSFNGPCGQPGCLFDQTVVVYTNGISAGQRLQLYWFPSLTLASNTLGVTYYGEYTDTNSPPLNGSSPWSLPVPGSIMDLVFLTESEGGSSPDAAGLATFLTSTPLAAFENWQVQYFGSATNPAAAAEADPDGDGITNTNEFLAGFNPTNAAAYAHIMNITKIGNDMNITYLGANGDSSYAGGPSSRTNVLEFSAGSTSGGYTNDFASTGISQVLSNGTGSGIVTNMLDPGGATNMPSRYYRIHVLP